MLKRKIYDELQNWKKNSNGKTALLIDGARRVGKSFIAEYFASQAYKSYILIDFANVPDEILQLFLHESYDLELFFAKLSAFYSTRLYPGESLIIFDEVQQFPRARQLVKYLVADGRYHYIETGSLIRLKKNTENILIPSEEEHIEMFPLDFEEFLWAMGDEVTVDIMREHYQKCKPLNQLHRDILRKFREYMCVGGMPQAVVAYAEDKDFEKVDFAKKEILALYQNDIKEQEEENSQYVGSILENIPSELSRHDSPNAINTFTLTHIDKNARYREYSGALHWLTEAMIVNVARNITDPSPALTLSMDDDRFKCYLMDTGLLINLSFGDGSYMDNDFYRAILTDRLHINEGMFVENVIAQCLRTNGHKVIFHVEYDKQGKMVMEIDFLIRIDRKIVPIEAKSGKQYTTKFLLKFKEKFTNKVGMQYVLHEGDLRVEGEVVYLPYYMAAIL